MVQQPAAHGKARQGKAKPSLSLSLPVVLIEDL